MLRIKPRTHGELLKSRPYYVQVGRRKLMEEQDVRRPLEELRWARDHRARSLRTGAARQVAVLVHPGDIPQPPPSMSSRIAVSEIWLTVAFDSMSAPIIMPPPIIASSMAYSADEMPLSSFQSLSRIGFIRRIRVSLRLPPIGDPRMASCRISKWRTFYPSASFVDLDHGPPGCGSVRLFGEEKPRRSGAIVKSVSGVLPICGHPKFSVSKISHTSGFAGLHTGLTAN